MPRHVGGEIPAAMTCGDAQPDPGHSGGVGICAHESALDGGTIALDRCARARAGAAPVRQWFMRSL